jgi:hypothetical protein
MLLLEADLYEFSTNQFVENLCQKYKYIKYIN